MNTNIRKLIIRKLKHFNESKFLIFNSKAQLKHRIWWTQMRQVFNSFRISYSSDYSNEYYWKINS
jgi:hypothetical protein